jgi:hypothetical protein
MILIQCPLR